MLILNIRALVSQAVRGGNYRWDGGTRPPTFLGTTFWLRPDPHHSEEIAATVVTVLCGITAKWYRFTSAVSDRIPEYCVLPKHCGTQWPIWINGQHPTGNF